MIGLLRKPLLCAVYLQTMSEKIIKCRKCIDCDECDNKIKYGEKYQKCKEVVDGEIYIINFCLDCVEKHELAQTECKKGNHDFKDHFEVEYEGFVPYPNYTGKFVCENCGIIQENIELQSVG